MNVSKLPFLLSLFEFFFWDRSWYITQTSFELMSLLPSFKTKVILNMLPQLPTNCLYYGKKNPVLSLYNAPVWYHIMKCAIKPPWTLDRGLDGPKLLLLPNCTFDSFSIVECFCLSLFVVPRVEYRVSLLATCSLLSLTPSPVEWYWISLTCILWDIACHCVN